SPAELAAAAHRRGSVESPGAGLRIGKPRTRDDALGAARAPQFPDQRSHALAAARKHPAALRAFQFDLAWAVGALRGRPLRLACLSCRAESVRRASRAAGAITAADQRHALS